MIPNKNQTLTTRQKGTNIAFRDIAGGSFHVYSSHPELSHLQRIYKALEDLTHTGCINIYLLKRNKLRLIKTKGY